MRASVPGWCSASSMSNGSHRITRVATVTLFVIVGVLVLTTVLALNLFPVITNDSLTYIDYSKSLDRYGLVHAGYRQFGYPGFMAVSSVGSLLGIEPLLTVAILQRLLLVIGVAYAVWLWRWWSVPIVAFALSAETIAYTNLLLTEGLTVPLALVLACTTAHFLKLRADKRIAASPRLAMILVGLVAALALAMLAIRFPFAVFGICPLVVVLGARGTSIKRYAWAVFGGYIVLSLAIVGLVSAENATEYGDFSPSTRGARTEYWAAWSVVFKAGPGNASKPELTEYWDSGTPYGFIREVESMDIPYSQQATVYEQAIDDMLATAGIGPWESRIQSFFGSLTGGRLDDLTGIIAAAISAGGANVDAAIYQNSYALERGVEAFADRYNDGEAPDALITEQLALVAAQPIAPILVRVALPLSIVGLMIGLMNRRARGLAVAGLAVVLVYSMLIGFIRADNYRFLLTTTAFAIASFSGALALWAGGSLRTSGSEGSDVPGADMPLAIPAVAPSRDEPSMLAFSPPDEWAE